MYGASPALPVAVDAIVEEEGWCGPEWQRWKDVPLNKRRDWGRLIDSRPDVFKEDLAFLRLKFKSARGDPCRTSKVVADPENMLIKTARVLSLGVPGYEHGSKTLLKGWHVFWESGAPMARAGDGRFRGIEGGLHNVLRFESQEIGPGFSGSPLWDPERRLVVGMIRRGLTSGFPDIHIATDSRHLARARTGRPLPLCPDKQAEEILALVVEVSARSAPLRHFPLLQPLLSSTLVELMVSPLQSRDPLADIQNPPVPRHRATDLLLDRIKAMVPRNLPQTRVVVLAGTAGAGKSTLMQMLSQRLLETSGPVVEGHRIVPLPLSARDFRATGFSLAAILESTGKRFNWQGVHPQHLAKIASLNDFEIVLLIDGLDEVSKVERARLLGALGKLRPSFPGIIGAVVATRPIDDIKLDRAGVTQEGFEIFEVQHLEQGDIQQLAAGWFDDKDLRDQFLEWLREVSWDRRGPTPLQLALAATLLKEGRSFPSRPIDLVFRLIDYLIEKGCTEDTERRQGASVLQSRRSRAHERYAGALRPVLRQIAYYTVKGAVSQRELIEAFEKDQKSGSLDPLFSDFPDLLLFLEREVTLRGGLISLEQSSDGDGWLIQWPHRSFAEALAAEQLATTTAGRPYDVWRAFQWGIRTQGPLFNITILAALDSIPHAGTAVDLCLSKSLEHGASDYNSTLVAVRALGAGIRMGDAVRKRCVKTLITLLLLPPATRLGPNYCHQILTPDDLPNPIEIARRPALRADIIEQLHERWRLRDPRVRRSGPATLAVSSREAAMLDALGMWADIEIPISRPVPHVAEPRTFGWDRRLGVPANRTVEAPGQGQATTLVIRNSEGRQVQITLDTEVFITDLIEPMRRSPSQSSGLDVLRLYVQMLLTQRDFEL